ncbi:MAG: polysaccharide biosynthesis/export family protein [Bacteroidaceae bacterium]|nr:polysaccharide biosynthesis/export family protein [Bacteroidaceae bacterium]
MKSLKFLCLFGVLLLFWSCKTPEQISYFQDLRPGVSENEIINPRDIKVRVEDKLAIIVNSRDPQLTTMFNLPYITQTIGNQSGANNQSRGISGYTVRKDGTIDFPVLGTLKVLGMTREEIAAMIKKELINRNQLKDPVVTVEFMNLTYSVLGEVSSPGRYSIEKDKVTILDAISEAGDLTIFGKRENVLVLRNENGTQRVYDVNLCSGNDIYNSPVYYLQQDDVVYVEPNKVKARQSTVNGNTIFTPSFWLSVLSLATTITVLIVK